MADAVARTFGWATLSSEDWQAIAKEAESSPRKQYSKLAHEAYAEGVNHYMETMAAKPAEIKVSCSATLKRYGVLLIASHSFLRAAVVRVEAGALAARGQHWHSAGDLLPNDVWLSTKACPSTNGGNPWS